jgi:hypothetical protein
VASSDNHCERWTPARNPRRGAPVQELLRWDSRSRGLLMPPQMGEVDDQLAVQREGGGRGDLKEEP